MPLKLGDTFFMGGTGGVNNPTGSHLMICVVTDIPNDTAIIVPVVSRHENSDISCVLLVGDHPFLTRESCAAYHHVRAISIADAGKKIKSRAMVLQSPVRAEVLARLQVGLVTSDETEPWAFNKANGTSLIVWLKHKGHL